jgi:hypothetical protein
MEKIRIQLLDQHHQYFSLTGLQNYRINLQLRTGCKKLVFFRNGQKYLFLVRMGMPLW